MRGQRLKKLGCDPPKSCFSCKYKDCIAPSIEITKSEADLLKLHLPYGKKKNKTIKNSITQINTYVNTVKGSM